MTAADTQGAVTAAETKGVQTRSDAVAEVAVVGAGLMGAALARALADAGHHVRIWNRTPERAQKLAAERLRPVRTIQEAVSSADLVIACTASYDTTRAALAPVTDWGEAALVNLGTGTPEETEAMAEWAGERQLPYLDGSLLCFPDFVGSPDTLILYAGEPGVWERHQSVLRALGGGSRFLSEQVRAACVVETAVIGSFYVTAVGAYVEAATYAQSQGVSAEMMRDATRLVLRTLGRSTKEAAAAIESGEHATDQATLATYANGARHCLSALRADGHQARLLAAAVENLEAARAAGLGELGIYAQTGIVHGPADPPHAPEHPESPGAAP
ncbi:NAD(P)-binding domain-containing protein [Streptomyces boluensis]|uniref:NAD(P)-binding domain-containing protein n=1 Tax=Streptomyces boluensis TaxID=1775135 RepID=A0A964UQM5_9ACTN|nr:NAD(P)-binding domain-containing protein [Streptomyces boluensis]NBE49995.1 NAD(P)-binding domain-containing protein [Streptomyces boluensis]